MDTLIISCVIINRGSLSFIVNFLIKQHVSKRRENLVLIVHSASLACNNISQIWRTFFVLTTGEPRVCPPIPNQLTDFTVFGRGTVTNLINSALNRVPLLSFLQHCLIRLIYLICHVPSRCDHPCPDSFSSSFICELTFFLGKDTDVISFLYCLPPKVMCESECSRLAQNLNSSRWFQFLHWYHLHSMMQNNYAKNTSDKKIKYWDSAIIIIIIIIIIIAALFTNSLHLSVWWTNFGNYQLL